MKHCLFQQHWGEQSRWVLQNPPESSGGQDIIHIPEFNIRENLDDLKESTERGLNLEESIESGDFQRIETSFKWHIKKLNSRYFRPEKLSEGKKRYKKQAALFEKRMQVRNSEKLNYLWEKIREKEMQGYPLSTEEIREELRQIANETTGAYKRFARGGNSISAHEANAIIKGIALNEKIRKNNLEQNIAMLNGKTEAEAMVILESMYYFEPKVWEMTVPLFPERAFEQAENDANEAAMVNLANELDGFKNNIKSYDEAQDYLVEHIKKEGRKGPQAVMRFMKKMENVLQPYALDSNQQANGTPEEIADQRLKNYSKYSFNWRYAYLHVPSVMPDAPHEKVLVQFMQGDRKQRKAMLRNATTRDTLFLAIHITQTKYKDEYKRHFRTERAQKNDDLRKKKASLGGLILLGEEAQAIVKNFARSPQFHYAENGQKYTKKVDLVKEFETSKPKGRIPGYKRHKKPQIDYGVQSTLEASGFNGRDLLVGGVKVAAMATIIVNSIATINNADSRLDGLKDLATLKNPTVGIALAVVAGTRALQKNPQYFNYFGSGGYEQERMGLTRKLNRMADKTNYPMVKHYIHNAAEWRVMADIQDAGGSKKMKEILNDIRTKRREQGYRGPNLVTKTDLKPYVEQGIISQQTYNRMSDNPMKSRMRYEFFQKFRSSPGALDVRLLKELCIGNAHIDN